MISVYYDGKCGLCSREIAYFKKRSPLQSITWHDIARNPGALDGQNVSQAEALMMMHVEDGSGKMHLGVDAFIVMWGQFRGWRLLAHILNWPVLYPLAGTAYRWFAKRRFDRYGHCQVAAKDEDTTSTALLAGLKDRPERPA